jgi:hypothetical protein
MFSYANRRIEWRGAKFVVVPGGGMRTETAPSAAEPTITGGQQGACVRRAVLLASVGLTAVLFFLHYELAAIGSALGAVGSTLRQCVHEVRSHLNHRSPPSTVEEKYTHQAHKVALTDGGFFERLAGAREIEVLQSRYGATPLMVHSAGCALLAHTGCRVTPHVTRASDQHVAQAFVVISAAVSRVCGFFCLGMNSGDAVDTVVPPPLTLSGLWVPASRIG